MSFSFAAAGRKDDVLTQLDAVRGDALATETAGLLARHVQAAGTEHTYTDEHGIERAMGYIVEASGHSGHGSLPSLSLSMKVVYFPVTGADSIAGDTASE